MFPTKSEPWALPFDYLHMHIIGLPENARHSGSRHPETYADITAVGLLAG